MLTFIFLAAILFMVLAFQRASLAVWAIAYGVLLLAATTIGSGSPLSVFVLWGLYGAFFLPLLILPLRRRFLTTPILAIYKQKMPRMSVTEQEALTAGGVGFEGEIFTGIPDWFALREVPKSTLTSEEQAFLAGPVEILCGLINNWEINHRDYAIPSVVWDYMKQHGFFGLIIPKEQGGKGFSALAHSQIVTKVASVSVAVATSLSVPNSLGPAELLLHYGTAEQQAYYLPRLACGVEIPCFALTSPQAGSDASAIEDYGIIVKRFVDGVETMGILLYWNKRYITLAPIATLLGLAFKCYDPDHLLGDAVYKGITCALISVQTPGVTIGRRHYPLCSQFPNGPTQGAEVFITLDQVIGGVSMIGCGWKMLMECLAAGRSISLPSMAAGSMKKIVYTAGAYARIRRQFNTFIGSFEGIQAVLARIAGKGYLMEALRLWSVTRIDQGVSSAVASAICKYHTTEQARHIMNDGMDIHGGKGICMGPHNYLAQSYIEAPISITVEGANILTRSLIIFGQGAVRCHPFVLKEMLAASDGTGSGLHDFDAAFFSHMGMVVSNAVRTVLLAISSGYGVAAPTGDCKRYAQLFSRFSAAFAWVSDIAMMSIGASLKRKEELSARLGDMLSLLYTGGAVIKYYELENNREAFPVFEWVCQDILYRLQETMHVFLRNFPHRVLAGVLRVMIFPFGRRFNPPSDALGRKIAALLLSPTATRQRLTQHLYTHKGQHHNPLADLEKAFAKIIEVEPLFKRLQESRKAGIIQAMCLDDLIERAMEKHIFSKAEADQLRHVNALCKVVIDVDDFAESEWGRHGSLYLPS